METANLDGDRISLPFRRTRTTRIGTTTTTFNFKKIKKRESVSIHSRTHARTNKTTGALGFRQATDGSRATNRASTTCSVGTNSLTGGAKNDLPATAIKPLADDVTVHSSYFGSVRGFFESSTAGSSTISGHESFLQVIILNI